MNIDSDIDGAPEAEEADDLRSILASAVAEHSAPDDPGAALEKPAVERNRDETGKFAPKPQQAAEAPKPQSEAASAAPDRTAPAATSKAPAGWSKEAQAAFPTLPPAIQAEVLKREADVARGFNERAPHVQTAQAFEKIAAPYRETLSRIGLDPLAATERLFAVEKELQRDPRGTVLRIMQAYGVDPRTLLQPAQQTATQPGQNPQYRDPRIDEIASYVESQKQAAARAAAEQHQAQVAATNDEISQFASDPAHRHFDHLRGAMSKLLTAGLAENLQDAYDKAAYADPAIREQLIAARTAPAAKAQANQAAVSRARAAAVSVKGAPVGPAKSRGDGSIRDAIREAMTEQA